MTDADHELIALALVEAKKMKAAVVTANMDAHVTMAAEQFAKLADMIEWLCKIGSKAGSFSDPRYWVPLQHFERMRQNVQTLEAACHQFQERALAAEAFVMN